MKKHSTIISFILLAVLSLNLMGQESKEQGLLNLDRIFASREFASQWMGRVTWVDFAPGYTSLERAKGGMNLVLNDIETGEKKVLVTPGDLTPEGSDRPLPLSGYTWSQDGSKLLIFTNTARVWRANTRGDYWILNLENKKLKQLGAFAQPSTLMFAKISPDGRMAGYVMKNNIYVEDLVTGKVRQLTKDGSRTIINGTFDWVYEEEFGCRDGFRWSPDSSKIAYWQLDAEGVKDFLMINNTDSLYPKVIPVQYPKVGTTNSAAKVGVVSLDSGVTTWMKLEGDPRMHYIPRMEWAANSEEIVFQRLNRLQNNLWIILGKADNGETKTIFTEEETAWISVTNDFRWLEGGKRFTWTTESDGWRHVYLVSRDGKEKTLVTKEEFDVIRVQKIDIKGGWLYFTASPENPTEVYLFRTPLDGSGKAERITPTDLNGVHRYNISNDGKYAFHTWSSFETPSVTNLVSLPDNKIIRKMVANEKLKAAVAKIKRPQVEFFKVDANGVELDAWMMKPYNFDPARKYPVLVFVYGEPASQTVMNSWGGSRYLWNTMLTQKGYIVVSMDSRGTPAPKGREWRKVVYGKIGIISPQDQANGLKTMLKERTYLDPERVGVWGWSGGGSMTLNAMFKYPDLYKMGMAVAFVSDQKLYDTIYQERYMGLPEGNKEGFYQGSPINFAKNLKGKLLLVHGTGDDNVHYQSCEMLVNELIKHNKQFQMMAYPNRSHGIYEGRGTTRHLYGLLTSYLEKNLPVK